MSKLGKVAKQHDRTWAQLNRRLISIPFTYENLFSPRVAEFLSKKAASIGSCPGYLVPCLLTTTAFVVAEKFLIRSGSQEMPSNLYMLFIGPPGTGKSQALKEGALQPMHDLCAERDIENSLIEKCTSSALTKAVAEHKRAYLVSPEVFEVLNKLLKSDEDNATGDVQVFCQLFSGESSSYRYATEKTRVIPPNVPFSIIGSTQVPYFARLLCRMDQGHGLLDRFMFVFPECLRPSTADTEAARAWFNDDHLPLKQIADIFLEMYDLHSACQQSYYTFTNEAQQKLTVLKDGFIAEVNDAIREGNVPPKSKEIDLVHRIATSLHVFDFIANELLHARKPPSPPQQISVETLERALKYVEYVETQKEIAMEVISSIVTNSVDNERMQPDQNAFKKALLLFPGSIVLYRGFRQAAARDLRSITIGEFKAIAESLTLGFGNVVSVRLRRQSKESIIFIKKQPNNIQPTQFQLCSVDEYTDRFQTHLHPTVTENVKSTLTRDGHVNAGFFN